MSDNSFRIKSMSFPRIESLFVERPIDLDFQSFYRIEGIILDDRNLRILFGVRLISIEKVAEKEMPKIQVTIDSIADFEFDNVLPVANSILDVPLVGNMLALMYPFIREKVNYCLSSNSLSVFLPPMNTIHLVKEDGGKHFKIQDARVRKFEPSVDTSS